MNHIHSVNQWECKKNVSIKEYENMNTNEILCNWISGWKMRLSARAALGKRWWKWWDQSYVDAEDISIGSSFDDR